MKKNLVRYLIIGMLLIGGILDGKQLVFAAPAPSSDEFAQVKIGESAAPITFPNMQGKNVTIDFKGKPTVIVSLHEFRIKRLLSFQEFYNKYNQAVNFYVVCHSDSKIVQQVIDTNGIILPILIDSKNEFLHNFNRALPSMLITDKQGIIRYNGTAFIDVASLNVYMNELTADKTKDLPFLLLDPPNYAQPAPPLMNIGDVITDEHLYDIEGNYITIKYSEKPTVLLFWAGFNAPQALDNTIPVIQGAYESRGNKANFYTVNFASNPEQAQIILNSYNSTVSSLYDKYPRVNLKYTYSCPTFVIIDQNGVIRYRPSGIISLEQLEGLIDSLVP
ncbi:TlpA family protein disulfide reductase [Pelosinus propionicus]|uniref:AhpC/TSA family protein n=1 Tax=Pelosinus propionicus DSM 13327 TaxID=1123291 RepID=A0A1I4K9Z1_9FIRM|nr:redoxin domain-containing protein [Pelosinus propionicus]SFL75326.1 AhpC/TSA family protein [Pelosinus propionicus DSM 13327]